MDNIFKDHFSDASDDYLRFRPHYPEALFFYLSSLTKNTHVAWDCATGNGQAAFALAKYFDKVIGTDASKNQITHAQPASNITYRVETVEQSTFNNHSVDLITVAQALHWFDMDVFSTEITRVLKPGGIVAAWTYGLFNINPKLDKLINTLYHTKLSPFWPPERVNIENGYASLQLPLKEIPSPNFQMQVKWNLEQLMGYLGTWSAVKKYKLHFNVDPVVELTEPLLSAWGKPSQQLVIRWPLTLKIWKTPD